MASQPASLAEAGIDKNLAQRARIAAAPSAQEFERRITTERAQIESPDAKPTKAASVLPPEKLARSRQGRIDQALAFIGSLGADEKFDLIVDLFQQLDTNTQIRCAKKLHNIIRGNG